MARKATGKSARRKPAAAPKSKSSKTGKRGTGSKGPSVAKASKAAAGPRKKSAVAASSTVARGNSKVDSQGKAKAGSGSKERRAALPRSRSRGRATIALDGRDALVAQKIGADAKRKDHKAETGGASGALEKAAHLPLVSGDTGASGALEKAAHLPLVSGATQPSTPTKPQSALPLPLRPDAITPPDMSALKPGKLYYRIGEVSQVTGVKPYVLRYWESEFRLMVPQKSRSKQRLYREKDIATILYIKRLLYEERYTIAGARRRLREVGAAGVREAVALQPLEQPSAAVDPTSAPSDPAAAASETPVARDEPGAEGAVVASQSEPDDSWIALARIREDLLAIRETLAVEV